MNRLIFLLALALAAPLAQAQQKQWVQLFNGRNLDGWIPKISGYETGDNFGDTFRVENGVLRVAYDKYDKFDNRFGHIFYRGRFSSYRIAVEYRFVGEQAPGGPSWAYRNSGIMIHCQAPETMKKDQDFPISIEVQLLGGRGAGERTTANLCTPGTNVEMNGKLVTQHCVNSSSKTYHGDQWVRVEVEVRGGNVTNFDPAVKKDGTILTEGHISLQSESHPVEFRKVELLELDGQRD